MIQLDTNLLIEMLRAGSQADLQVRRWLRDSEEIATSAIAWGEFLCGPLGQSQLDLLRELLSQVVSIDENDAVEAARLFNDAGRRRGTFQDCLIAAVALRSGAALATRNNADFSRFEKFGLQLVG